MMRLAVAPPCLAMMVGCGGGSSGGSPTPTATVPPTITSAAAATTPENASGTVYTATALEPQGAAISWDIAAGADAARFAIAANGNLSFRTPPNFDLPADGNGDNIYEVAIRANSANGSVTQSLQIAVTNDREGIRVTRIATGLTDPVGIASTYDGLRFVIAERAGRVVEIDGATGVISEMPNVAANIRAGEILDILYASGGSSYSDGLLLLTHSAVDGLLLQGYSPTSGRKMSRQLAAPWSSRVAGSLFTGNGTPGEIFAAIGDPGGNLAQTDGSGYGKLFSIIPGDPYAGASVPSGPVFHVRVVGDGIRAPSGGEIAFNEVLLVDQGAAQHEISRFVAAARPLDFGWPSYEGTQAMVASPPPQVVGPLLGYAFGTGPRKGTGIIAGTGYAGAIPGIVGHYVFGDRNGSIFSIRYDRMIDGAYHGADEIELRTADFAPNAGTINSPVAFAIAFQTIFILDADGEVFRVDAS